MPRIVWTMPALDDLRGIDDWLEREASPEFALRIVAAIHFRARFLEDFPHGGRPHPDGTRVLRVYDTPYLIRYRIVADRIEALRVHHEREDWSIEL